MTQIQQMGLLKINIITTMPQLITVGFTLLIMWWSHQSSGFIAQSTQQCREGCHMTLLSSNRDNVWTNDDFGDRSRYLRQGWVIRNHSILWDAITYPCLRYLLLVPKASNINAATYIRISLQSLEYVAEQLGVVLTLQHGTKWAWELIKRL